MSALTQIEMDFFRTQNTMAKRKMESTLTKREQIAMHAMQGILSNPNYYMTDIDKTVKTAYYYADKMLKQG